MQDSEEEGKYKLTKYKVKLDNGEFGYRIVATRDFADIKKGEKGGYIQGTWNLCMYDNSWVNGDAKVYENAFLYEDARVSGNALVFGNARVSGNAHIYEKAWVHGESSISGCAKVHGDTNIYGQSVIKGASEIEGEAEVRGNSLLDGFSHIYHDAIIEESSVVGGLDSSDTVIVSGRTVVTGDAKLRFGVYHDVTVSKVLISKRLSRFIDLIKRDDHSKLATLKAWSTLSRSVLIIIIISMFITINVINNNHHNYESKVNNYYKASVEHMNLADKILGCYYFQDALSTSYTAGVDTCMSTYEDNLRYSYKNSAGKVILSGYDLDIKTDQTRY